MTKIENISILEKKVEKSKELDSIIKHMEDFGIDNPLDLLPKNKWHDVSFILKNTHVGFAHGLYRILVEELQVICADVKEENIVTDDKFISDKIDRLVKNINLLPVKQSLSDDEVAAYDIYLYKYNDTDDIIDITINDFVVVHRKDKSKTHKPRNSNSNRSKSTKTKNGKSESGSKIKIVLRKGTNKGSKLGGRVAEKKTDDSDENSQDVKDEIEYQEDADNNQNDGNNQEIKDEIEYQDDADNNQNDGNNQEIKEEIEYQDDAVEDNEVDEKTDNIENRDNNTNRNTTNSLHKIKGDVNITEIFPETNCLVVRLRPGKYIKINHLFFEKGMQKDDASKFSLLNNITYQPLDIKPYDIYAKTDSEKGTRSIEHDCKEFKITFATCGNIEPTHVIELLYNRLTQELNAIKQKVIKYSQSDVSKKYYTDEGIEVTNINNIVTYTIYGQYLTTMNMLSQRCYVLDTSISFCCSAVKRYDSEIGIIKLTHADPNKLLITAIDSCIQDMKMILDSFNNL